MTEECSHLDVSRRLSASTALVTLSATSAVGASGSRAAFVTSILLRTVVVFDVVVTSSSDDDVGGFLTVVLRWESVSLLAGINSA